MSQQEEQEAEDGGERGGLSLSEVEGPVGTVLLGPVESIHKPVDVVQSIGRPYEDGDPIPADIASVVIGPDVAGALLLAMDRAVPDRAELPELPDVLRHVTVPVSESWGHRESFKLTIFRVVSPKSGAFHPIWAGGRILRFPRPKNRPHRGSDDSPSEGIPARGRMFLELVMLGMRRRMMMRRRMREPGLRRRWRRMQAMEFLLHYSISMSSGGRMVPSCSFFGR